MTYSLGIIGFGNFGQFITPYIKNHFDIYAYDIVDIHTQCHRLRINLADINTVLQKDIIMFCIPVQYLEQFLIENVKKINPNAIVLDVSSVKIKPIELFVKHLPTTCQILGTHPLFGPQSGKNGIEGLNFVLCPVRTKKLRLVTFFLKVVLKLNLLIKTPDEHDEQMAYVQALTHFIGRAINHMDIPDLEQKTPAYQYLLDIKRNLGGDSYDLFLTIENENPYASSVRKDFLQKLNNLDIELLARKN